MSKIAFITSTSDYRTDKIYTGVFGSLNAAGQFEIAPELKGIYLFNQMTPAMLAEEGVDLSSSIHTADVPEEVVMGVKATLLNAFKESWLNVYDQKQVPAGFAKAALEAEKESVRIAVEKAIENMGLVAQNLNLSRPFVNVHTTGKYSADDEYESDEEPIGVEVNASNLALLSGPGQHQWALSAEGVSAVSASSTAVTDYASGIVNSKLTVYAEPDHTEELNVQRVLDAVFSLPAVLLGRLPLAANAFISAVEFHSAERVDASEPLQTAEEPPAP